MGVGSEQDANRAWCPPDEKPTDRKTHSGSISGSAGPKESITVRLDPELAREVRRACALRAVDREVPYKQQDVVAAALRDWLKRHAPWQQS